MGKVWQGAHIRLRAVEPDDWETFFRWNQDSDQARRLDFVHFPISAEATRKYIAERAGVRPAERPDDAYALVIEDAMGAAVGGIATHACDRRVGSFAYGLNVLPEHRGRGYATDAVRLVLRYMFRERRYQKCTIQVYDFNEASVRLHERLGFRREGCLRRMGYTDGQYFDVLVYGITAEEFAALP